MLHEKNVRNQCRLWLDTETTGLDTRKHFAFQLSYFIEEDGRILTRRMLEMRPDTYDRFEFSPEAERVHGWSKEKIAALSSEADAFALFCGDVESFAGDRMTVCGFCTAFDIRFVRAFFERQDPDGFARYNRYFKMTAFDVHQFASGFHIGGLLATPNLKLETLCRHFGISTENAHQSMADITNTYQVFQKLLYLEKTERPTEHPIEKTERPAAPPGFLDFGA